MKHNKASCAMKHAMSGDVMHQECRCKQSHLFQIAQWLTKMIQCQLQYHVSIKGVGKNNNGGGDGEGVAGYCSYQV